MEARYFVMKETSVDARFSRLLATANNSPDNSPGYSVSLMVAPEIGADEPSAIVYMATNGDPVYIACIGPESANHITEEMGWTEKDGDCANWLLSLREFGFAGAKPYEAIEFIEELMDAAGVAV